MPSRPARRPHPPTTEADAELQAAVDAFRRIVRALRLAERETRAGSGLSAAQLFVLRQLAATPAASLTALAERTLTDRTSVAAVVERLVAAGLVTSDRARDDRRRVAVRITERGRAVLRRSPAPPTMLLMDAVRALPAASRRHLIAGLDALVAGMGLRDEPAGMLFEDQVVSLRREQ
ncbi:MAG TPA: MarR family winged helix-turn-helix transcriptional regulator [Gemmatimonadaceae bacterium]|nr:MarR family winged helix-turn-helix transcriptional regulator [Gemmatimonadaceae bacterium]